MKIFPFIAPTAIVWPSWQNAIDVNATLTLSVLVYIVFTFFDVAISKNYIFPSCPQLVKRRLLTGENANCEH
jgi:hypothetical protein